jgi:hypothetical protein
MSANLWWSYDADNGSFAALPAGPALLPAIGIFAIFSVYRAIKDATTSKTGNLPHGFVNSSYYKNAKKRQDELIQKKVDGIMGKGPRLSLGEQTELTDLQHPSWANGGSWSF